MMDSLFNDEEMRGGYKFCKRCGVLKPPSDFYTNDKSCKKCRCNVIHNRYLYNKANVDGFIEKERERGRSKYKRLNYISTAKTNEEKRPYKTKIKDVRRYLIKKGYSFLPIEELHHWNYNFLYSVFVFTREQHKFIHKFIRFTKDGICRRKDNGTSILSFDAAYQYFSNLLQHQKLHPKTFRYINE